MATSHAQDPFLESRRLAPLMGDEYHKSLARRGERPGLLNAALTWHIGQTSLRHTVEKHFSDRTANRINRMSALKLVHAAKNRSTIRKNLAAEKEEKREWGAFEKDILTFAQENGGLNILQIGANDGRSNDKLFPLVSTHEDWRITFVEPMDSAYDRLKQNYDKRATAKLVQRAIVAREGPVTMHYIVPNGAAWENIDTVATTKPETLDGFADTDYEMAETEVQGTTLFGLARDFDVDLPGTDLLFIDAEGCDYAILKQALENVRMRPAFIIAEHDHMQSHEFTRSLEMLMQSGYQPTVLGHDLVARRQEHL